MTAGTRLLALALISCSPMTSGLPAAADDAKGFISSSSSTVSSANGYHVSMSETNLNGECITSLTILGNGIRKVLDYPCRNAPAPTSVINLNKTLLVGDEYFSDTPGHLVRVTPERCELEVFTEKEGKFTSTVEDMDEKNCEKVKLKIVILKEHHEKWAEWYKQKQQEAQQQLAQVCSAHQGTGYPQDARATSSSFSNSNTASSSDTVTESSGVQVRTSREDINGKCTSTVTIEGNGIHKQIQSECRSDPTSVINRDGHLLVNGEWYSDTAAELVHLAGDKCSKEVFHKEGGQYRSKVEPMDAKDCQQVKEKVEKLKENEKKLQEDWEKWMAGVVNSADQQKQQMEEGMKVMQQGFTGWMPQNLYSGCFPFGCPQK